MIGDDCDCTPWMLCPYHRARYNSPEQRAARAEERDRRRDRSIAQQRAAESRKRRKRAPSRG